MLQRLISAINKNNICYSNSMCTSTTLTVQCLHMLYRACTYCTMATLLYMGYTYCILFTLILFTLIVQGPNTLWNGIHYLHVQYKVYTYCTRFTLTVQGFTVVVKGYIYSIRATPTVQCVHNYCTMHTQLL